MNQFGACLDTKEDLSLRQMDLSVTCREVKAGDDKGQSEVGQCLGPIPSFSSLDMVVGGCREGSGNEGSDTSHPGSASFKLVILQVIL